MARRRGLPDVAFRLLAPNVDGDALLGNCTPAHRTSSAFVTFSNRLAMLAFCEDSAMMQRAEKRAEEVSKSRSEDPLWNNAQLPLIRASIEFGDGQPAKAIDLLQSAAPYERAITFAIYLRGLAYLRLKKGPEAAREFQKIVDHRGANWGPMYPLAYVGLARAAGLTGDTARARKAYLDFFTLWTEADLDVPVLIQARKEDAALKP